MNDLPVFRRLLIFGLCALLSLGLLVYVKVPPEFIMLFLVSAMVIWIWKSA